jgi:AraC-like DNA-binding protein
VAGQAYLARENHVDVLSDLLATVRLESTVFAQARLFPPWGIRAGPRPDFAFHILARGAAHLEIDDQGPVDVSAGDVVILAPGRGHTLRDRPGSPARDLPDLLAAGAFAASASAATAAATRTRRASAELICGCFHFRDELGTRLFGSLPTMIRSRRTAPDPWLRQTVALLTHEVATGRPGTATVVNRLCDALFVYVLRGHLTDQVAVEPGVLNGLADARIAGALAQIHERPATAWTVARLAAGAGMSRSAFAARFAQAVGQPPMAYVYQWRLHRAAASLRDPDARVDMTRVAGEAGYDSVAAFSKAFKRIIGVTPGAWRRTRTSPAAPG